MAYLKDNRPVCRLGEEVVATGRDSATAGGVEGEKRDRVCGGRGRVRRYEKRPGVFNLPSSTVPDSVPHVLFTLLKRASHSPVGVFLVTINSTFSPLPFLFG